MSTGCPSENFSPCRSVSVYCKPSAEIFHAVASAGSVSCVARLMCTRSACIVLMTSREGVSAAIIGFSVFGSAFSAITMRPPRRPASPATRSSSSFLFALVETWPECCGGSDSPRPTKNPHHKIAATATPAPICADLALRSLISNPIRCFLYLRRPTASLQQTREHQVSEKERHHRECRQVHPPVRGEDVVMLQAGQQVSPTWHRLGHAQPKNDSVISARTNCGTRTAACVNTTFPVSGKIWRRSR